MIEHHVIRNLVFGLVGHGRRREAKPAPDGDGWVLRYSAGYRGLLIFAAGFVVALVALMLALVPEERVTVAAIGGFWGVVALIGLVEAFGKAIYVGSVGMRIQRPLRSSLGLVWEEVESVTLAKERSALRIKHSTGTPLLVSIYFNGLGTLCDHLDLYAPGTLDERTRVTFAGNRRDEDSDKST